MGWAGPEEGGGSPAARRAARGRVSAQSARHLHPPVDSRLHVPGLALEQSWLGPWGNCWGHICVRGFSQGQEEPGHEKSTGGQLRAPRRPPRLELTLIAAPQLGASLREPHRPSRPQGLVSVNRGQRLAVVGAARQTTNQINKSLGLVFQISSLLPELGPAANFLTLGK